MNPWRVGLLFAAILFSFSPLVRAEASDPIREEPFSTFIEKLNAFAAQPTERALRDLEPLCRNLPVRDLKPGQVGEDHPQDRDMKLRCMLRFVAAMDALTLDHLPTAYMYDIAGPTPPGLPTPEENAANIQVLNFQVTMQRTREAWVKHYLPRFLADDCREVPPAQLQQVVADELKGDARGKDAVAALSRIATQR